MQMISAINAELAKIGYKAVKLPRLNRSNPVRTNGLNQGDRLNQWNPQTQAGRKCKAAMARWAKWPKPVGVTSYQVLAKNGKWYSEGDKGFEWAVAYRRRFDCWVKNGKRRKNGSRPTYVPHS